MMQIINNTGAIIKEQINLGNIDNLNIDDLFKNNTNNKKMKNNNCPNWLVPFDIAFMLERIGFIAPENFYIYSIYDNNNFDKCCGRRDTYEEAQQECVKALIQTYKNELEKNNL